jgi:toxic protein SymE
MIIEQAREALCNLAAADFKTPSQPEGKQGCRPFESRSTKIGLHRLSNRKSLCLPEVATPHYKGPPTAEELDKRAAAAARRGRPRAPRRPEQGTVHYSFYKATDDLVPLLRLRGRWLEELGLHIGCPLRITGKPGKVVIEVVGPPPPPVVPVGKPWEEERREVIRR